jgi:uncharacterized integral membrane protein (TIGR00698 family)
MSTVRVLGPGLAVGLAGLLVAQVLAAWSEPLSPIVVAVVLGILLRNVGAIPSAAEPGLAFAARTLLRVGIVLLGFRLALGDLFAAGAPALAVVIVVVLATLGFTYWLGRRLSLPPELALLTGTGFAICGATAVAAMREVIDADDDAPAFAIALVTMFGTLSILLLPLLAGSLQLTAEAFGQWAGAAVHDVGQVVATAAAGGDDALAVAVVVKLTRVLLLGPMLVVVGLLWRRRTGQDERVTRPALVPPFIIAFVAAAAVRTAGVLPGAVIDGARTAEGWFLTVALLGLGTGVRLGRLRTVGTRGVVLGLVAFVFVAGLAYLGVVAVHGTARLAR